MTVYLLRENVDNADVSSVHLTLDGAKRTAEHAAGPTRDGYVRNWEPFYDDLDLVETHIELKGREVLYSVQPFEVREE